MSGLILFEIAGRRRGKTWRFCAVGGDWRSGVGGAVVLALEGVWW
jgi:hypothetical protein